MKFTTILPTAAYMTEDPDEPPQTWGFTGSAYESLGAPERLPEFIPPDRPWLSALLDAIGSPNPDCQRSEALWSPPWGQDDKPEEVAPEHAVYLSYMRDVVIRGQMPWLLSLLDAARAIVFVSPGACGFVVHTYAGVIFDINELVPHSHLLPWATADEMQAPH